MKKVIKWHTLLHEFSSAMPFKQRRANTFPLEWGRSVAVFTVGGIPYCEDLLESRAIYVIVARRCLPVAVTCCPRQVTLWNECMLASRKFQSGVILFFTFKANEGQDNDQLQFHDRWEVSSKRLFLMIQLICRYSGLVSTYQ